MKTIWKYPLTSAPHQTVMMPYGALCISVIEQAGRIVLYAMVEPEVGAEMEEVGVYVKATGHDIIEREILQTHAFLGTVKMPDDLIWHIFVPASHHYFVPHPVHHVQREREFIFNDRALHPPSPSR